MKIQIGAKKFIAAEQVLEELSKMLGAAEFKKMQMLFEGHQTRQLELAVRSLNLSRLP